MARRETAAEPREKYRPGARNAAVPVCFWRFRGWRIGFRERAAARTRVPGA